METILKVLSFFNPYNQKCPNAKCSGRIKPNYLDSTLDKLVWDCTHCKIEWI